MNMILEGLGDISEAKQKLWYIEYTSKGTTDAKVICNSQSYNKYKKFAQGYKEIEKIEITDDSEKRFYTSKIRDELEDRYGIEDYTGNNRFDTYTKDGYVCTIVGKYKTDSYGYMVSDTKLEESCVSEAKSARISKAVAMGIEDAERIGTRRMYDESWENGGALEYFNKMKHLYGEKDALFIAKTVDKNVKKGKKVKRGPFEISSTPIY